LPVLRSRARNLLHRAISRVPRILAWRFSSVSSCGSPVKTPDRLVRKFSKIPEMGISRNLMWRFSASLRASSRLISEV
jgi:hypothetical protein